MYIQIAQILEIDLTSFIVYVLIPHGREGKITFCSPDAQGQTKKSKPEGRRPEGGFFCLPEGGGRGPRPKGKLKIQAQGPKARGWIFCLPEGLGPGLTPKGRRPEGGRPAKSYLARAPMRDMHSYIASA